MWSGFFYFICCFCQMALDGGLIFLAAVPCFSSEAVFLLQCIFFGDGQLRSARKSHGEAADFLHIRGVD